MKRRALCVLAIAVASVMAWLAFEALIWPDVARLAATPPGKTAFMRLYEKRHGRPSRMNWVPYAEIADTMKRAVLVAEDIDFFSHQGFAVDEMRNAFRKALEERELPRGASTITQQLAKNLWLSPARTPRRKLREALLTRSLEKHLEKRRILEIYLNVVEFGDDTFGCEAASRLYFGKPASRLSAGEAARLAAVLPRPSQWSPVGDDGAFLASAERIRRRMGRARWLRSVI